MDVDSKQDEPLDRVEQVVVKSKDVWKDRLQPRIDQFSEMRDYDDWDDDAGQDECDYWKESCAAISRQLDDLLRSQQNLDVYDRLSHICGAAFMVLYFWNDYWRDSYGLDDAFDYEYEVEQFRTLVQSEISFDDKLFCVKVFDRLVKDDSILNTRGSHGGDTKVGDKLYNWTWPRAQILLHFVNAGTVDELSRQFKLWLELDYRGMDKADDMFDICREYVSPFFPLKKYLSEKDHHDRLLNWALFDLCVQRKDPSLFHAFVARTEILKRLALLTTHEFVECHWVEILMQCFNGICAELMDQGLPQNVIQSAYAEHVHFFREELGDRLQTATVIETNALVQAMVAHIPAFIDVSKIKDLQHFLSLVEITSCQPSPQYLEKQADHIERNRKARERMDPSKCTPWQDVISDLKQEIADHHEGVIKDVINFALRLKNFTFVANIIDCVVASVEEENVEHFIELLFVDTDIKNHLKSFSGNLQGLFDRIHSNDILDVQSNGEKYLDIMNLLVDCMDIQFIQDNDMIGSRGYNALKCILLYRCTLADELETFSKYLRVSRLTSSASLSLQIALEALRCARNKDIIFIRKPEQKEEDEQVIAYRKQKEKCCDAFAGIIAMETSDTEFDALIACFGANANEYFFNSSTAVSILKRLFKDDRNMMKRDSVLTAAEMLVKKCFTFWGDRWLDLSQQKQLQIDIDEIQQYLNPL